MNNSILLSIVGIFCISCASTHLEPVTRDEKTNPEWNVWRTRTTSANAADTMATIIRRQHDPDLRMLNQIIKVDGEYRLAYTKEEAVKIGIPENIYRKYEEYVRQLNNRGHDSIQD